MNKQIIYDLLETKQLNYTDYQAVIVRDNGERLVAIPSSKSLAARGVDPAMAAYTGDEVFVRETVLKNLQTAARLLQDYDVTLSLEVGYGYRALEIQKQIFEKYKTKFSSKYSGAELLSRVHKFIAVPEVAGHPAGAAVDIQIVRSGQPIDFGTNMWEFKPDSFTFSPFISKEGWQNRQLLRRVMMNVGFAPFDGEWWHFSYGDKEWAKYYNQPSALYQQEDFSVFKQDSRQ